MKIQFTILLLLSLTFYESSKLSAQELYFPEIGSEEWETIDPSELGWCEDNIDELLALNENGNSKALIILKGGKIALEAYFGDHDATKNWYWASAGKSLTASIIGVAQEEGFLNIDSLTSQYLGEWTSCDSANEQVTVRHQLTMTTGLDYTENADCLAPECLTCLNEEGTEWYYHNPPYTLLQDVVANATGQSYLSYTQLAITNKIGMNGFWLPVGENSVYFSTARSMARFGLMMQANGDWDGEEVIADKEYFNAMISPSQDINKAYGYLWWLNGQESFRLPSSTITFQGSLLPEAPMDTYMAIGKNGQYVIVIPSEETIIIRMGDNPDVSLVPLLFLEDLMAQYKTLECANDVYEANIDQIEIINKVSIDNLRLKGWDKNYTYSISNYNGMIVKEGNIVNSEIDVSSLHRNLYFITFYDGSKMVTHRFFKG